MINQSSVTMYETKNHIIDNHPRSNAKPLLILERTRFTRQMLYKSTKLKECLFFLFFLSLSNFDRLITNAVSEKACFMRPVIVPRGTWTVLNL